MTDTYLSLQLKTVNQRKEAIIMLIEQNNGRWLIPII